MYAISLSKTQDFGVFCSSIILLTHVCVVNCYDPQILISGSGIYASVFASKVYYFAC